MIVYDLQCESGHRFEGWFGSADDFATQQDRGLLECPSCGAKSVVRVPSAARINMGAVMPVAAEKTPPAAPSVPSAPSVPTVPAQSAEGRDPIAIAQMLYSRMLDTLLSKSEDVGKEFAVEARRIHNDEAPKRAIRGQATQEEHDALLEEGVPVMRLPIPPDGHWN